MRTHELEKLPQTAPRLLRQVEEENEESLKDKGLIARQYDSSALLPDRMENGAQTGLLRLQRARGNRYVQGLISRAGQNGENAVVAREIEEAIQIARGGGQALDGQARSQMESFFGADFSNVRVYTGRQADALNRSLNARAFTTGRDIFFKQNEYNPGSSTGRELLAHELTHVVQQNGDKVQTKLILSQTGDCYEQQAENMARAIARQESRSVQRSEMQIRRQTVPEEEEEELIQPKLDVVQREIEEVDEGNKAQGNHIVGRQEDRATTNSSQPKSERAKNDALRTMILKPLEEALQAILVTVRPSGKVLTSMPQSTEQTLSGRSGAEIKLKDTLKEALDLEEALRKKHKRYGKKDGFQGYGEGKDQYVCTTFAQEILGRAGYKLTGMTKGQINIALSAKEKERLGKLVREGDPRTKGIVTALVNSKQGVEISIDQLEPGDFVQYWSSYSSGHVVQVREVLKPGIIMAHGSHKSTRGVATLEVNLNTKIKVYCVRPIGNSATSMTESTTTMIVNPAGSTGIESSAWFERAVKSNVKWGRKLGWLARVDEIVLHFQTLGYLPPLQTPNEELFARAVKQYQNQYSKIANDGVIGPRTWSRLSSDLSDKANVEQQVAKRLHMHSKDEAHSSDKPYIIVRKGVVVTPYMRQILNDLEVYFKEAKLRVQVSSAVRTPESQLDIIKRKAIQYGLDKKYPSIKTANVDDMESWRDAWDELLNVKGFIVNPPKAATCKLGPRKGWLIRPSPHLQKKAFDLTGVPLKSIEDIVVKYKKNGGAVSQILVERVNNCVHIGIK